MTVSGIVGRGNLHGRSPHFWPKTISKFAALGRPNWSKTLGSTSFATRLAIPNVSPIGTTFK
jgi:hypothetical protein